MQRRVVERQADAHAAARQQAEAEAEGRLCIICEAAPRHARFACGHAIVCEGCLDCVVKQHKKCPTCGVAFGPQPVMERGEHVRVAPTFVMPMR